MTAGVLKSEDPRAKVSIEVPLGGWRPVSIARCILCNFTTDDPVEFNQHRCYIERSLA